MDIQTGFGCEFTSGPFNIADKFDSFSLGVEGRRTSVINEIMAQLASETDNRIRKDQKQAGDIQLWNESFTGYTSYQDG